MKVLFNTDGGEGSSTVAAPVATAAPAKKVAAKAGKKPAKKKAAKKAAPKKKAAKKKVAKKAGDGKKRSSSDDRDTIRLRMFKLLKKNSNGLTGSQIKDGLELTGIPNILRDEGIVASPPRIRRLDVEGVRGVVYQLTAAGLKAIENGTVNSGAPASANGIEWPDGR